jgi:hypothetical protein
VKQQPGAMEISHPHVVYGGSYYRSTALLDCVDRVLPTVNWKEIHARDNRIPINWDTVPPVLFALGGYKTIDWNAACEKEHRFLQRTGRNCSEAALKHKNNPAALMYDRVSKRKSKGALLLSNNILV